MKKTLTCLILYLVLSPIVADALVGSFGAITSVLFFTLWGMSIVASLFIVIFLIVQFLSASSESIAKEIDLTTLDERIFGGKK